MIHSRAGRSGKGGRPGRRWDELRLQPSGPQAPAAACTRGPGARRRGPLPRTTNSADKCGGTDNRYGVPPKLCGPHRSAASGHHDLTCKTAENVFSIRRPDVSPKRTLGLSRPGPRTPAHRLGRNPSDPGLDPRRRFSIEPCPIGCVRVASRAAASRAAAPVRRAVCGPVRSWLVQSARAAVTSATSPGTGRTGNRHRRRPRDDSAHR